MTVSCPQAEEVKQRAEEAFEECSDTAKSEVRIPLQIIPAAYGGGLVAVISYHDASAILV